MNQDLLPDLARARNEFLASGDDRLMPIVDAHHHFWDLHNPHPWLTELPRIPFRYGDYALICKNFLPDDYVAQCGPHRVLRHVVMEGEWTPTDPAAEAFWMQSLAQRYGKPQAMAAQIWLDRPDAEELMQVYTRAPLKGFVRSVRHKPTCASREDYRGDWTEPGSMRCPIWRQGYARLASYGLMFELQAPWWHMPEALELARDFPETRIIVNHAGLPGTREAETLRQWRAAMGQLVRCPNILVKISGLGVRGEPWTIEQQAPVVDALISDFGVERCLFASNHPVDALVVGLEDLWSGFKALTRKLIPERRLALFCDNAVALYGLR
ncbi:MAG: amidohydrolase family protein [Propionivibrio sp.]